MSGVAAPALSLDQLAPLLAKAYGLTVRDPRWLEGEYDRNLRLIDDAGAYWVVKISDGSAAPAVAWQEALLTHIEQQPLDFVVPRLLPTTTGARHIEFAADNGQTAIIRILSWVDGTLLCDVPQVTPALLRSIGKASAQLTNAYQGFAPETMPPRHHWLIEDALESFDAVRPLITGEAAAFATELDAIRDEFAQVKPVFANLPQGVVHQDLHDQNVMVDVENGRVSGAIDFNDAYPTALVADLAISGAYGMLRQSDPVVAVAEVVQGYREFRALSAEELRVVLPAAAIRLAINWLTWAARGSAGGEGYARARSLHTRPTLELLLAEGIPAAAERLALLLQSDQQ